MPDANQVRRQGKIVSVYALITVVLAAVLLATGQIPRIFNIPPVVYLRPRPASAPSLVSTAALRTLMTGKYHITNVIHGGPSSWGPHSGVLRDQLERLLCAVVLILLCLKTKAAVSVRWVRASLTLAFLLGAASSLSDLASFYVRRGVVDWIGVSGANGTVPLSILLSPTDVFSVISALALITLGAILLWKKVEQRRALSLQLAPGRAR